MASIGSQGNGGSESATALGLFDRILLARSEAVAIEYFDGSITYSEIEQMSNGFAHSLIDGGFAPGDRLMLYMQNLPHFAVCILGAWKAGGIVVPINPMYRAREVGLLLNDCAPQAIVLTPDLNDEVLSDPELAPVRPKQIFLANPHEFQTRDDPRVLPPGSGITGAAETPFKPSASRPTVLPCKAEDISYIVYTSGTSGKPKGVKLTNRNVTSAIAISVATFDIRPDSKIIAIAPLFHVTGLIQHVGTAIGAGCALVLIYRFNPTVAIETIRERKISHVAGASTAFIAMMNVPGADPADMRSVRAVTTGGAPTAPAVVERMKAFFGVQPRNAFGLTETAIGTHITGPGEPIPVHPITGAVSVGPPNIGMSAWISDAQGQKVPPGVEGEIVVVGPTISAGYWNKPEETAEVFRPEGFYTGDIGVMDERGWYYIVDRKKDMISASGYKVWPREVEDVLYGIPSIREAAVVGVPDGYRGETVKAVISVRAGHSLTIDEVSTHCSAKLAAYKRPRIIEFVDDIPKTVSGKILRRELK